MKEQTSVSMTMKGKPNSSQKCTKRKLLKLNCKMVLGMSCQSEKKRIVIILTDLEKRIQKPYLKIRWVCCVRISKPGKS